MESNNLQEYLSGTDPNNIVFYPDPTNRHCSTTDTLVPLVLQKGVAFYASVLVDTVDTRSAIWSNLVGTSVTVPLGTTGGWHSVAIGLRGHAPSSQPVWQWIRLKLDQAVPLLVITNPAAGASLKSLVQIQGYATKPLASISFGVSNSSAVLSNIQAFVKDQYFDTNLFELTTNYFQCFDVWLTNGPNLVTISASDFVGNRISANMLLSIDSSMMTNAPAMRIDWPMDQMFICQSNFAIRGWVNDPSASVTVSYTGTNGITNSVLGIVDRYGAFWVEGIPLAAATNSFALKVADPWGNVTATNLTLYRTSLPLTVNTPGELYKKSVTVSGSVDPAYAVWVNGVPAMVSSNGAWTASAVPVTPGSTASFDVMAAPASNLASPAPADPSAANLNVNVDKPWRSFMKSHHMDEVSHVASYSAGPPAFSYDYATHYVEPWVDGEDQHGSWSDHLATTSSSWFREFDILWPATFWEEPTMNGTGTDTNGGTGGFPGQDRGWKQTSTYYPSLQVATDGCYFSERTEKAQLVAQLFTGGKSVPNQQALFEAVSFGAKIFDDSVRSKFHYISPDQTSANTFGTPAPGTDVTWALVPVGEKVDITPSAPGASDALLGEAIYGRYTLRILAAGPSTVGWQDVTEGSMSVVVGEGISLSWEIPDYGISAIWDVTNFNWTIPGYAVGGYDITATSASLDTNINLTDPGPSTFFYWVDGGTKQVQLSLTLGGKPLKAKTTFSVTRPLPSFRAEIRDQVRVDTNNWYYTDTRLPHDPGVYLHFGTARGPTNDGIVFIYENAPSATNGFTYGTYALAQVIESLSQRYNIYTNGTCESGYVTNDMNGLDGSFPSLGPESGTTNSPDSWADSPGAELTKAQWLSYSASFSTYLMFRPNSGGIYVPMYKLGWEFSGSATNNPWGKRSGTANTSQSQPTTEFPRWTHTVTKIDTSPQFMLRTNCFNEN